MKLTVLITGLCIGVAPIAAGHALAHTAQTTTKYITVDGEILRYEAGRTIVVRGADGKEVVYTLSPAFVMPADATVGRRVTLYTEEGGIVSRVTTTTVTPEGNVKRTTEDTRTSPMGVVTKTTTTHITGKVEAYEPGKTLTIMRADGTPAVYQITRTSTLPTDLVVGRTITIVPSASGELMIKTVTYVPVKR